MNDWPKAVTTGSIWIAIGFAMGFGLFKMNFSGHGSMPLLLVLTLMLIGGGLAATLIVWRSGGSSSGGSSRDD